MFRLFRLRLSNCPSNFLNYISKGPSPLLLAAEGSRRSRSNQFLGQLKVCFCRMVCLLIVCCQFLRVSNGVVPSDPRHGVVTTIPDPCFRGTVEPVSQVPAGLEVVNWESSTSPLYIWHPCVTNQLSITVLRFRACIFVDLSAHKEQTIVCQADCSEDLAASGFALSIGNDGKLKYFFFFFFFFSIRVCLCRFFMDFRSDPKEIMPAGRPLNKSFEVCLFVCLYVCVCVCVCVFFFFFPT